MTPKKNFAVLTPPKIDYPSPFKASKIFYKNDKAPPAKSNITLQMFHPFVDFLL